MLEQLNKVNLEKLTGWWQIQINDTYLQAWEHRSNYVKINEYENILDIYIPTPIGKSIARGGIGTIIKRLAKKYGDYYFMDNDHENNIKKRKRLDEQDERSVESISKWLLENSMTHVFQLYTNHIIEINIDSSRRGGVITIKFNTGMELRLTDEGGSSFGYDNSTDKILIEPK